MYAWSKRTSTSSQVQHNPPLLIFKNLPPACQNCLTTSCFKANLFLKQITQVAAFYKSFPFSVEPNQFHISVLLLDDDLWGSEELHSLTIRDEPPPLLVYFEASSCYFVVSLLKLWSKTIMTFSPATSWQNNHVFLFVFIFHSILQSFNGCWAAIGTAVFAAILTDAESLLSPFKSLQNLEINLTIPYYISSLCNVISPPLRH